MPGPGLDPTDPDPTGSDPTGSDGVDLDIVAAEIAAEVHRRRASGEFPPDLERRLDEVFARYAPAGAVGATTAALLERVEERVAIDTDPPTSSARPGVPVLKAGMRRAMAWYVRYVADQVSALGHNLLEVGRTLDRRVTRLESLVSDASEIVERERRFAPPSVLPDELIDALVTHLAGAQGRVLHAECGAGLLVERLASRGASAYGIEPRRHLLAGSARLGLDVRSDEALEHLRRVDGASLGAVVLSGVVDLVPLAQQLELADHAVRAVRPGGHVLVVVTPPYALAPVLADLSSGHPLRPVTWEHVLAVRGCPGARPVAEAAGVVVVGAVRGP